ncbi:MAG: AAA family ATPase, partial [Tannerellaceae bacterium]|nr:AAA family ATPase [Tannerellaceae bacterium]
MKRLPIGIQSFVDLRNNDYLYADKTEEIHRLITSGKTFFLSRPRRFGKSLLISTLEAIFKGDKALFKGLYIYDRIDWTRRHPVIKLDWSSLKHSTAEEMECGMREFLDEIAQTYQITLTQEYAANRFNQLIKGLHHTTGEQVVVLVDEYDMPILDAMNAPVERTEEIRQYLQSFYKILKATDEHLRFVFLTGVSKFAKV